MIVHHDEALVIAEKPAGLPTVPGRPVELHDCLWHRVREIVPDALVVHRLDMATSGLVLFARGIAAQRALGDAFARRLVAKTYVAIAAIDARSPAEDAGTVTLPLAPDWPNRPRQKVDAARGKASVTDWRVSARDLATGTVRLTLVPRTGRSHQLRVHCASIGLPLLGDTLYAPPEVAAAAPRLMLHASALRFMHPIDGDDVAFASAPPF